MIILIVFGKEDEEKDLEVLCSIQTFFFPKWNYFQVYNFIFKLKTFLNSQAKTNTSGRTADLIWLDSSETIKEDIVRLKSEVQVLQQQNQVNRRPDCQWDCPWPY